MAEIGVLNSDGTEVGKMTLLPDIFEIEPHRVCMHAAVVAHRENLRLGASDTKTRAEVSGGGRKPWRQKGTGRARQGSIRAPHWTGGGVVFGPHPKEYRGAIPKKVRRLALKSALSAKLASGGIKVLDELRMESISTKQLVETMERIGVSGKALLVLARPDDNIKRSARNIYWLNVRIAPSISTYDLLNAETIVFVKDAVSILEEAYAR